MKDNTPPLFLQREEKTPMPTKKRRITFAIDDELLSKINQYSLENNCKNQSQAILSLINKGLHAISSQEKAPTPSDDDAGAKLAVEEVIAAFVVAGIVPEGQDLSDEDLKFFSSILAAVSQWFAA